MKWVALALLLAATAQAQTEVLPPKQAVAGVSQADWGTRWWQWAGQFDDEDSPVADRDGSRCAAEQRGPVWFLAGTYGTARTQRQCTVPAGKHLFFPLVNFIAVAGRETRDCAELQRAAKALADPLAGLILSLDGRRIELTKAQRQRSKGCFNFYEAVPDADPLPAAADGYWVMLAPLPPGRYRLEFGGVLDSLAQGVSYQLEVR